jgi:hypothetical protein
MVKVLPPAATGELGQALHAKLNAPPTAAERRVNMLRLLAQMLDEQPQHPGNLPYIARQIYDQRRSQNPSLGPTSARLQREFGSWARACYAAWGLLDDGRHWGEGEPWARPPRQGKGFTATEAITSIRTCAKTLGRVPSSYEYHTWVINRRARARRLGQSTRPFVLHQSVLRLLAPDRRGGNGWRLVVERVFRDAAIPRRSPTVLADDFGKDRD